MARNNEVVVSPFHPLVIGYGLTAATIFIGGYQFYRNKLRRISKASEITNYFLREKYLYGKVTSVGDGDNFHFFHTPGGIFAGWGWARQLPEINSFRKLKNKTIHVRLCGVDAPERSHFGKPAQPFSDESLQWLRDYILGKRVYIKPLHLDQYSRMVSKVKILKWNGLKDVSGEMIKNGIGVVYEGKSGAEFDGKEDQYRKWEKKAKKKKLGLWGVKGKFISPGQFKALHK